MMLMTGTSERSLLLMRSPPATKASDSRLATNATDIDKSSIRAHVGTYRNGYGTYFSCTTTCYSITAVYLLTVGVILVVFFLIPVQPTPLDMKKKTYFIWFGCRHDDGDGTSRVKEQGVAAESDSKQTIRSRFFWWVPWIHDRDRYQKPMSPITCLLRAWRRDAQNESRFAKVYHSIGVDTEDLVYSPRRRPRAHTSASSSRGSIFSSTSPRQKKPRAKTARTHESLIGETSFFADLMASPPASPFAREESEPLGSLVDVVVETKESAVLASERRATIQHRAEKRMEVAKSDFSYENLGDEEIQMYEYLEFIRDLLDGMQIKKICQKSAKVVRRTFFINPEMTTIYWNKFGNKNWRSDKSSIDTSRIDRVLKGLQGNPNLERKGKAEKSMLYVSIICSDGKCINLEAKDEVVRQRLFLGFSRLSMEKRQERLGLERGVSESKAQPAREQEERGVPGSVVTSALPIELLSDEEEKEHDVYSPDEEEEKKQATPEEIHPSRKHE